MTFADLAHDLIDDLLRRKICGSQPRIRTPNPAAVEQTARPNSPADRQLIVFGFSGVLRDAGPAAAKSTEKNLRAHARKERAVFGRIPRLAGGVEEKFILAD